MSPLKTKDIEARIIVVRRESVLLDADVAAIYGVTTREVNQAVANNTAKFPAGYILELTAKEKQEVVKKFDHLKKLKFSPHLPKAFSERGPLSLSRLSPSPLSLSHFPLSAASSLRSQVSAFSFLSPLRSALAPLPPSVRHEA
jgi:hypothetical protein